MGSADCRRHNIRRLHRDDHRISTLFRKGQRLRLPSHNGLTRYPYGLETGESLMPQTAVHLFVYHQMLVLVGGAVCLLGTWVGMRHFARARATEGTTRYGWLFMASVGTGAALWASTFISILALDPLLDSSFEPVATGLV